MSALDLVNVLMDGGEARSFFKALKQQTPEVGLQRLGFKEMRGRSLRPLFRKAYPRPVSMPTPYDWPTIVIVAGLNESGDKYELGLCTMGQAGMDYPDLWMGQFQENEVVPAAEAMVKAMENLPGDVTYDQLDRIMRQACGRSRQD